MGLCLVIAQVDLMRVMSNGLASLQCDELLFMLVMLWLDDRVVFDYGFKYVDMHMIWLDLGWFSLV